MYMFLIIIIFITSCSTIICRRNFHTIYGYKVPIFQSINKENFIKSVMVIIFFWNLKGLSYIYVYYIAFCLLFLMILICSVLLY